ncbi:hypothetical protein OF83DRAFT_1163895 [Amylostereum chailletii]|nr:hypothetical protein OF83DRAFT_1163895 [Amylostereum chailletii]
MARSTAALLPFVLAASLVAAQNAVSTFPATPLVSLHFPTPSDAPYHADPGGLARGDQVGYNQCNSTTEGDSSMCQTGYVNGLGDFCLWAPQQPNSLISDTEADEVAWCTSKGHGTRVMADGTIKGAQLLKTPDYWMITGLIDQTKVNIQSGDFGGELDPGGQDLRGNPIGGLMYSTAFNSSAYQINEWTNFMGSNQFCIKICNPSGSNPTGLCQHTLDRIGSAYNCPSKYTVGAGMQEGEFEVCDSENMDVPGVYTENGQTLSYSQPPESLGAITTVPYQPRVPASSNCQTTASAQVFTAAAASAAATATGSAAASKSGKAGASGSRTGSASSASSTGQTDGAVARGASRGAVGVAGVGLAMALLA